MIESVGVVALGTWLSKLGEFSTGSLFTDVIALKIIITKTYWSINNLGRTMPEVARREVGLILMAGLFGPMF